MCYYTRPIRDLYPMLTPAEAPTTLVTAEGVVRGTGQVRRIKPARCATTAPPGSLAKVLVLQARAAAGQELWHEHDATLGHRPSLCDVRLAA